MLYIGVSGFHPLQAFGLQLPQATFDQPKTYIRLNLSILNLTPQEFYRFPGSSCDHSFLRSTTPKHIKI